MTTLKDLIPDEPEATASQDAPVTAPAESDSTPDSAPEGENAGPSTAFSLRGRMEEAGYDVSDFEDDDSLFGEVSAALEEARSQLGSPEWREFQQRQQEFSDWMKSQKASKAEDQQKPEADPVKTAANQAASTPPTETVKGVSEEAKVLAQQGLITKGEDGQWVPKSPHFQSFADEMNQYTARKQATLLRFADDPEGFLEQVLQKVAKPSQNNEELQVLKSHIEKLEQKLAAQEATARDETVKSWVQQNRDAVFDKTGKLTPFGETFDRIEKLIRKGQPDATSDQVLKQVLDFMKASGVKPPQKAAAAEAKTPEKKPTAATKPPRHNGVNRLDEYVGKSPANKTAAPRVSGLPSLRRAIESKAGDITE